MAKTSMKIKQQRKPKFSTQAYTRCKICGLSLIHIQMCIRDSTNVVMSARNVADVDTTLVNTINVYDVMKAKTVVLTKDAVAKIEEVYA